MIQPGFTEPVAVPGHVPGPARLRLLAATCGSLPLLAAPTPFLLLMLAVLAPARPLTVLLMLLLLLLAAWQGLLAWRLRLDAELFRLLAEGLDESELDHWLACWLRRPLRVRTLAQREYGTLQLLRRYRWATALVWLATLLIVTLVLLSAVPL